MCTDITNILIIFILLILIPASCSIIAMWKDEAGKGVKFSITVSLAIAIFSFLSVAFQISYELDKVGIISIIASIISIPTAIAVGWNIYTIIDVKSIRKDFEMWKEDTRNEINTYKEDCKNKIKKNKDYADTKYDEIQKRVNMIDFHGNNAGKILNVTFNSTTKEKLSTMTALISSFCSNINVSPSLFVKTDDRLIYLNGGFADKYIDILVDKIKDECGVVVNIRFSDLEHSDIGVPIKTKDGFKMPDGVKPLVSDKSE